ncbi:NACHT, LRR and PYD domains-containing protein 3-like isoform X2 [Rhincodon typus]|uniref:NACHT, LRR and PYD domains-containing protein 3-like isoform X2 n=1 Tax=Rhincodon typus TaxID=259920 RepID=UPI00202FA0C7|nr:NACHT, LRR and PYD domains-containing protein 3-like isoform X2 [Rhincodon typus]
MADSSYRGEDPATSTRMLMDTDPNLTTTKLLTTCDDYWLFQLTKFYSIRLAEAIEEMLEGLSLTLADEANFTGQEYDKVIELVEKGNRADSSKLLLNLVMEKGSQAQRVMWQSLVKLRHGVPKLDEILKEMEHLDVQQKHKKILRVQTEALRVNTVLVKEKIFPLADRYTELTVISTAQDQKLEYEHELLARGRDHEKWREKHFQKELQKIQIDQLFRSGFCKRHGSLWKIKRFFRHSKSGSSVAVGGVPGIGKTTMVQKIVFDWAIGKIYPQFQFVFSFKFRYLNTIQCRINLRNLILDQYPYFGNVLGKLWKNPEGLLFIFDGLDEFKDSIDFSDNRRNRDPRSMCTDPECWCEVSDIVCSLIQHKLLPGCSVLVTSRPATLHLLEKAEISVSAEILGFLADERKEYFNKFFEDQTVAAAVYKHVNENDILYTMSYNPSFCWILCLSLGPFFTYGDWKQQQVPKTITQLYSYYIYNILKHHSREIENPHDVLLKLGELAFTGVSEKKIVFRNGDLIQYNLQPSQFLSGFMMEVLERDDSVQSVVYTFPHLTIQEFMAALAQFLIPDPMDIQKLLNEVQRKRDGRFELFLHFITGLTSPQAAQPLEEFLGPFPHQTTCRVIDWLTEVTKREIWDAWYEPGEGSIVSCLHYLFESQSKAVAQATVGSVQTFAFSDLKLTQIDCAILSHVIGFCDTLKQLDLFACFIQCEGLQRLVSVLHKCQDLRLTLNNLQDSGVKLLCAALRNPDCKIQELKLGINDLTASCAEDLAAALVANQSLTLLDLGHNGLGDVGVKLLSVALKNPDCKIQSLRLDKNGLTDSCTEELSSALITNESLIDLSLGNNNLQDSGVKLLSVALSNPDCGIKKLNLEMNGITDSCIEDLSSALSTNQSLTLLTLNSNSLTDRSVPTLQCLVQACRNLELIQLKNNLFSPIGRGQLETLQGSRLCVTV